MQFFEITEWRTLDAGYELSDYHAPGFINRWTRLATRRMLQVWGKCSIALIQRGFKATGAFERSYAGVIGILNGTNAIERSSETEWGIKDEARLFNDSREKYRYGRIDVDAIRNQAHQTAEHRGVMP